MNFSREEQQYYHRHMILPGFGPEAQQKLKDARVLVIGAGGLGTPVLQYLAGAGVGTIGIVDGDVVSLSNMHRQVIFAIDDIGCNKAEAAAAFIRARNPHISVDVFPEFLDRDNVMEIFPDYDVIIDGSDNFQTRYLINDACVILDKPLVYGAIYTFSGQVSVFNHDGGPTYRCLYPEPPAPEDAPSCAEIGVLGVLPGIIGSYQALETIKLIAELEGLLSGELLIVDTLKQTHYKIGVALDPENLRIDALEEDYDFFCGVRSKDENTITWSEFQSNFQDATLIDVRPEMVFNQQQASGVNITIDQLQKKLPDWNKEDAIVIVCQSGRTSAIALQIFLDAGYMNVRHIEGGYNALA